MRLGHFCVILGFASLSLAHPKYCCSGHIFPPSSFGASIIGIPSPNSFLFSYLVLSSISTYIQPRIYTVSTLHESRYLLCRGFNPQINRQRCVAIWENQEGSPRGSSILPCGQQPHPLGSPCLPRYCCILVEYLTDIFQTVQDSCYPWSGSI